MKEKTLPCAFFFFFCASFSHPLLVLTLQLLTCSMGGFTASCAKTTFTTKTWNRLPKRNKGKPGKCKVWKHVHSHFIASLTTPPLQKNMFPFSSEWLISVFQILHILFGNVLFPDSCHWRGKKKKSGGFFSIIKATIAKITIEASVAMGTEREKLTVRPPCWNVNRNQPVEHPFQENHRMAAYVWTHFCSPNLYKQKLSVYTYTFDC